MSFHNQTFHQRKNIDIDKLSEMLSLTLGRDENSFTMSKSIEHTMVRKSAIKKQIMKWLK